MSDGRHNDDLARELTRRMESDLLQPRDAYQLLVVAVGPTWDDSRREALAWLERHPEHAVTLVAVHGQLTGPGSLQWHEQPCGTVHQPMFSAQAVIDTGAGAWKSEFRIAASKAVARQQAALSMIPKLGQQPTDNPTPTDPTSEAAVGAVVPARAVGHGPLPPEAAHPVMTLHEWSNAGVISDLALTPTGRTGPSHQPTFTVTAQARRSGTSGTLTATGSGASKSDAKARAAQALLDQIRRAHSAATVPDTHTAAGRSG